MYLWGVVMKLYFVRHGKTDWNLNRLIQGKTDIPLSDIGIKESKKIAKKLKDVKFDVCYSSSLKRAMETAKIIVEDSCEIIPNDLIVERDLGRLEGTLVHNYKVKEFWDINYQKDEDGVETPKELLARTKEFLDYLKKNYTDETILVVSHSGTIKALHYNIVGYDDNTDLTEFYSDHNEIYIYEI